MATIKRINSNAKTDENRHHCFMFRMVPYKNNSLTEAEVKVVLAMMENNGENKVNRFYPISLEYWIK